MCVGGSRRHDREEGRKWGQGTPGRPFSAERKTDVKQKTLSPTFPRMNALIFDTTTGLHLQTDRPLPMPSPSDALLRVRRAGICATDLEIVRGYVPGFCVVLGHEAVADVVEVGCDVDAGLIGQRVVPEINAPPESAPRPPPDAPAAEQAAFRNHCPDRTVLGIIQHDGVFAEYAVLPAACCVPVPPSVPDAAAVFVEPLAAAFRIIEQGLVDDPDASIAVVGDGRLGLLIAAVLATRPGRRGRVVHIGRHAAKLSLIPPTANVEAHVLPTEIDTGAAAADWARASGLATSFTVVVDATGRSAGVALFLALIRPLGTLVLKTTAAPGAPDAPAWASVANAVVVQELSVVGSRCGPYAPALAALADEGHPVRLLVDAMVCLTLNLEDGVKAVAEAGRKGVVKVQLVMQ